MEQYRKTLGKVVLTCNDYWDKTKSYNILCLVEDKDTNKNYISKKEVPAGVLITNREYWQPIASMGAIDNGIIILNHTDINGNIPYYDLISAAKSINPKDRRPGLVLGYLNYDSNSSDLPQWKLYQYNDVDLANWLNISSWQALDYNKGFIGWFPNEEELYKEYGHPKYGMYAYVGEVAIASVIYRADDKNNWVNTGEKAFNYIVNFADEEDITNKNNTIKFADKIYNSEKFSGLGRVYLRKNIVNGANVLTQDMITKTNTIYIIQYDYNLQGTELNIPEGCVLDFQGGSLSNGKIIGKCTSIKAGVEKIFDLSIDLKGVWNVAKSYPQWFGAVADGENDTSDYIEKSISFAPTHFPKGSYLTTKAIVISKGGIIISGEGEESLILAKMNKSVVFNFTKLQKVVVDGLAVSAYSNDYYDNIAFLVDTSTSTRGNTFKNIYINKLQKGIEIRQNVWGKLSIQNFHHLYLVNTGQGISIRIMALDSDGNYVSSTDEATTYYNSNTTFISDVDIIGAFDSGIVLRGSVISIRDFNIAGSGDYKMKNAITIAGSVYGSIDTGWIEGLTGGESPSLNNAISLIDTKSFELQNINFAQGSLFLDNCQNIHCSTLGFSTYSGGIVAKSRSSALIENCTTIDRNTVYTSGIIENYHPSVNVQAEIIPWRHSLMYYPPVVSSNNLVSVTEYTDDFLTGYRAIAVEGTASHGAKFAYAGLKPNQPYTFCYVTKPFPNSDANVLVITSKGSKLPGGIFYGQPDLNGWTRRNVVIYADDSGSIEFKLVNSIEGKYILDSIQLFYGVCLESSPRDIINNSSYLGGKSTSRPNPSTNNVGLMFFDTTINKSIWWTGDKWVDSNGNDSENKLSGTFANKPVSPSIGYQYFCTNRQTSEGATTGIMIYHKGDDVWVDALGRVVE